ncbi:O-antigen ligase family protein, partial [Klebsiella pneumoniae]|nr:O-antigen ligase family protein [Klebsiella pneumoniae]
VLLSAWLILLIPATRELAEILWNQPTREILSTGIRPDFWLMSLAAIAQRPLFGYGWNQAATAHIELSAEFSHLTTVMGHSHNLFLDLLIWNGVVIG